MRVKDHPILGKNESSRIVTIYVDGRPVEAWEEDTIASAMLAAGMRICRETPRTGEARGVFCGIGQCTDCVMQVDGIPNIRTCITPVREGMDVRFQKGIGQWRSGS